MDKRVELNSCMPFVLCYLLIYVFVYFVVKYILGKKTNLSKIRKKKSDLQTNISMTGDFLEEMMLIYK